MVSGNVNLKHFKKLFEEHHTLQKQITRFETEVEVTTDEHLEELKKQRLHLKDQLYGLLKGQIKTDS